MDAGGRGVNRRSFLVAGAGALACAASPPRARAADPSSSPAAELRLMKIRHSTFLVEIGGTRVLVDPCFSPGLGRPFLFDAPPPALDPEEVGRVDVLLVTGSEPETFDPIGLRRLRGRDAACLVADDEAGKSLRHLGFGKVRVVVPGDRFETRGVVVEVSPCRDDGARPGTGFLVSRGGRSVWHTGAPPPLDVAAGAVRFAESRDVEVALVCEEGLTPTGGAPTTLPPDDAMLLARLCGARFAVPQRDDGPLTLAGRLLFKRRADERVEWPPGQPRRVVVEPGVWYRVTRPGSSA